MSKILLFIEASCSWALRLALSSLAMPGVGTPGTTAELCFMGDADDLPRVFLLDPSVQREFQVGRQGHYVKCFLLCDLERAMSTPS